MSHQEHTEHQERQGRGRGHGHRFERGDLRYVLLERLADQPAHGYELDPAPSRSAFTASTVPAPALSIRRCSGWRTSNT